MSWGLFPMRGEKGQSRSWARSRRSTSDHPRMGVERTQSSRMAVRLNCGASTMEYRSRASDVFRNTVVVSPALTMRGPVFRSHSVEGWLNVSCETASSICESGPPCRARALTRHLPLGSSYSRQMIAVTSPLQIRDPLDVRMKDTTPGGFDGHGPSTTCHAILLIPRWLRVNVFASAWPPREAPGSGAGITRAAQRSISLPVSALQTALIVLRTASSDRPATPALSTRSSIERTPFTHPA
jgi:hypothetical protein